MKQIRQISIRDVSKEYMILANRRSFIPKNKINSSIANKVIELNKMSPTERSDILNVMIRDVAYVRGERPYTTCGCESHFGLLKLKTLCITCSPNSKIAHDNRVNKRAFPVLSHDDYIFMWNLHKNVLQELNLTEYLRKPIPLEYVELYEAILFPELREYFTDYKEIRTLDKKYIGCDKRFFQFNIYRQYPKNWSHSERQNGNRNGWDLDHIRPCATPNNNLKNEQDIIRTFSWWNFQPLTKEENRSKGAR